MENGKAALSSNRSMPCALLLPFVGLCFSQPFHKEGMLSVLAWGLLGPEMLATERRTRTLGLGATVRAFNDLAVPGLGGVWFGKQLFLATLGVAVAERVRDSGWRVRNIEVANAVEALGCWLALDGNGWKPNPRLRGATKMRSKTDLSFVSVRRPSFYVTQPMRQATVQPMRALGLADSAGERFNSFRCTELGKAFIEAVTRGLRPNNRTVLDHLVGWAQAIHDKVRCSGSLTAALSPLRAMPESARELLREQLVRGTGTTATRRRKALGWIDVLRKHPQRSITWDNKPDPLDESHWNDLHAGALFFVTRDAAISLLNHIEAHIANQAGQQMSLDSKFPDSIVAKIDVLRQNAHVFLDNNSDPSPEKEATAFCRECSGKSNTGILERLLDREGRVLRQCGRDILPGVAFRGFQVDKPGFARSPEEDGAETTVEKTTALPDGISYRVHSLFLLNLDLHGELNDWLGESEDEEGEEW